MKKTIAPLMVALWVLVACEEVFYQKDISEIPLTIVAPADSVIVDTVAVLFSWMPVKEASKYHLQVVTPGFDNASQMLVDSFTVKTSLHKELTVGDCQWRVKALNSISETAYTTGSFTISD